MQVRRVLNKPLAVLSRDGKLVAAALAAAIQCHGAGQVRLSFRNVRFLTFAFGWEVIGLYPEVPVLDTGKEVRARINLMHDHLRERVYWNPYNKMVLDHHSGVVYEARTNVERARRGLPTPWTWALFDQEVKQPPIA